MTTLDKLIGVVRSRPTERQLCCPKCGGRIVLDGGRYWCMREVDSFVACEFAAETLADLAVVHEHGRTE